MKAESDWTEAVYDVARQIPRGRVASYGFIAKLVGTSPRMVGWAMNKAGNQKPKVPAHRVVNRQGLLTGAMHFETPTQMQELLEKEGVIVKGNQIVNFEKHLWQPK